VHSDAAAACGSHALDRGATLAEVQATDTPTWRRRGLSARAAEHLKRAQAGRGDFSLRRRAWQGEKA